jgi:replicative DNA helicase
MTFENNNRTSDRRTRTAAALGTNYAAGKLPPQAKELEVAVLGALMIEREAINEVAGILKPEVFYVESHQRIYNAIRSLQSRSQPIDILTVTAELRSTGEIELVGGAFYITELTNRVASAANIEFHARIIIQQYIKRELISLSSDTINQCYEDTTDILELLTIYEARKDEFMGTVSSRKEKLNAEVLAETIQHLQTVSYSISGVTGLPSGLVELDRLTTGWQKSDLVIVAARPGMGKTSFVLSCATHAGLKEHERVVFFSLEQPNVQLMQKEIAIHTQVPLWKFKKNKLDPEDWSQINSFVPELNAAQIIWDDTASLSLIEFRAKCRRLHAKGKLGLIIIDYLQLMTLGNPNFRGTRENEITKISMGLKQVAKELNVPVVALSQLSRKVEDRPGGAKRPQLSDLRESGAIEQDADMVIFIYRPEYYGIEYDTNNNPTEGLAELIVAKNRHGETGDVCTKFNKNTTGFENLFVDGFSDLPAEFIAGGTIVQVIEPPENFKPFTIQPNTDFDNSKDDPDFCPF